MIFIILIFGNVPDICCSIIQGVTAVVLTAAKYVCSAFVFLGNCVF